MRCEGASVLCPVPPQAVIALCEVIKTRGSFPSDEAALKLLYLAIQQAGLRCEPAVAWPGAKLQFMVLFFGSYHSVN
jgi:transposase-like protein